VPAPRRRSHRPLDDRLLDLVNAAGLPHWLALLAADAGRPAVDASTAASPIARRDHPDDIERARSA